jgi:hypothetical protein
MLEYYLTFSSSVTNLLEVTRRTSNSMILSFEPNGLLPPGDYEASFEELRKSVLTVGSVGMVRHQSRDSGWRERLADNFEILVNQIWTVGIRDIYADGSSVEDKDHPNDIDGYFVCGLRELATGDLAQQLNLLDPHKVWTWDPLSRKPYRSYLKNSSRRGIAIVWSSIRMCLDSVWAAASETNMGTNWNFRRPSVSPS